MNFLEYSRNLHKHLTGQFGKYKVFTVDGANVRKINSKMHEFSDWGIHPVFSEIPKDEIWIDSITNTKETFFAKFQALKQYRLIDSGLSVSQAYNISLKEDKKIREIVDGLKFHPEKTSKDVPEGVHIKEYCKIGNIVVWLVDGEVVRDEFKTDFVEGGNGQVYKFCPNNEIWIEKTVRKSEIPLIILHEFVELTLMKYKRFGYNRAHEIASKVDFKHEGNFNKSDAESLTKDMALQLAKPYLKD